MKFGLERLRRIGPGALITAAFVGPGTVTTCARAGAGFGYSLLWAVVLSTAAALILQEMSARLGVLSGRGLAVALREKARQPWMRAGVILLVLGAVGFGCAAFEVGNVAGGGVGLSLLLPITEKRGVVIVGMIAAYLLIRGGYRFLEKVLIALVVLMGSAFLITAALCGPSLMGVLRGMFAPSLPEGATVLALGLLGTTVVPYNLYLHSRAVTEKGYGVEQLSIARLDLFLCIPIGGLLSLAIVITAAVAYGDGGGSVESGRDLAVQLAPLLGEGSKGLFGFGLFAAGLTSALTAPVAASYAVCGALGKPEQANGWLGRIIGLVVIGTGVGFAISPYRALDLIQAAQVFNGILLPVSAIFLLWVMNDRELLGNRTNGFLANLLGVLVVLLALFLGLRSGLIGLGIGIGPWI